MCILTILCFERSILYCLCDIEEMGCLVGFAWSLGCFSLDFIIRLLLFVSWIEILVVPFIKPTGTLQSQSAESLV